MTIRNPDPYAIEAHLAICSTEPWGNGRSVWAAADGDAGWLFRGEGSAIIVMQVSESGQ